jgi:hypothetical protein
MKLLTASNPAAGLWALSFQDKLRVLRTLTLVQVQTHQKIMPYQHYRYGSNVPFRHGPMDVVKYSATPLPDNPARPLQKSNLKGLQDELIRHLKEDGRMSSFDFGVQFLDSSRMTYWGKPRDNDFWIENASVDWKETEAPVHKVARLTLLRNSQLQPDEDASTYFDVTGNSTPDSTPVGSINRARSPSEVASRKARAHANGSHERSTAAGCPFWWKPIAEALAIQKIGRQGPKGKGIRKQAKKLPEQVGAFCRRLVSGSEQRKGGPYLEQNANRGLQYPK